MARAAVETYGLPIEIDPHKALLEELHRTAGHVAWLSDKIRELEATEGSLYGPVGGGQGAIPSTEAHIYVRLYQDERKHLAHVAKTCVACGIEERRVRLAEDMAFQIVQVIRGVLTDLGVDGDQRVPAVVRRHLTLVASNG